VIRASGLVKGQLLVASPNMEDPNFFRTVVLVLEHGAEGALGVILNRPSEMAVAEPLATWAPMATEPPVVFLGGPVAPGAVLALGRAQDDQVAGADFSEDGDQSGALPPTAPEDKGTVHPKGGTDSEGVVAVGSLPAAIDLDADPASLRPALAGVRIFAGHAGWGPHQLEAEIIAGGWFVVEAEETDAFSPDPTELWWTVLGRQSGALARLAMLPLDPSLN